MKFSITDLTREQLDICEKALSGGITVQEFVGTGEPGGPVPVTQPTPLIPSDPTVTTGNESEFDADGMPWDERIHSSAKTKTQKGVWKKRKGVDDATHAAVTAELKGEPVAAVMPVEPMAQQPQVDPTTVFTPEQQVVNADLTNPGFVNPGPAAVPVIEQPAQPVQQQYTYADLMASLSAAIQAQSFDQNGVAMLNTALGINNLQEISADGDKINQAMLYLSNPTALVQAAALANPAGAA